ALLIISLSSSIATCGLAYTYIYHRGAGQQFAQKRFVFLSALFIGVPIAVIFTYALREGISVYIAQISQPATLHAI
ncbi:hypothetical protein ACP3WZ_26590, partial [Salmonella enterica]|uniref:hypothetical protein n=1 Tax=Salmonella enterica TaxID=28901 RepID=UPI003CF47981